VVERQLYLTGFLILLIGIICADPGAAVQAQEAKTVIGPANPELNDGAHALLAGEAEEGVRLTLIGLRRAANNRELTAAHSNLCAGYVQLGILDEALMHCNAALEVNERYWRALTNRALAYIKLEKYDEAGKDLDAAEAIVPNARNVKEVRAMLRNAVDPVEPSIIIDDRRNPGD
jgi:tetratricopeptide (TPR) repeat protein